ncbi:MAG: PAS domain S-box protein [Bacteroidota bacterium]
MNSKNQNHGTPWPFIVLFYVLASSSLVLGFIYYKSIEKNLLADTIDQLSAIADLKVRQIMQWRDERLSDGIFLSANTPHVRQFSGFIKDPANKSLKADLLRSLRSYTDNYDFRNAVLIDKYQNVRLFYPDQDTIIGDYLKELLSGVIEKGKVVITDIHQTGNVSFVHLDLIVPLKGPGVNDSTVFAALVLRIDPNKILYPILQSWPVVSRTAEALLIHVEGEEVVYLNKLRHAEDIELALRKPLTRQNLSAVMAVQGIMETTDAIDYRGVPVLAAMKKVPGTPWFLIAKIDREEAYSQLYNSRGQVILITVMFILMSGFFLGFLWRRQRIRFYKDRYESERERMALVKHFDYILKNANDIILLVDKDFIIVEANDKACETYQFDRQELIGKNANQLRSQFTGRIGNDYQILGDAGHLTYETVHRRKDGTEFPIEISARRVEIEGIPYYQSIGRDITERKIAEEILRESEEKFRKVFEESPFSMVMTGKDMGIISVNTAFCNLLGYGEEELLGLTFRNFTHPEHISQDELNILRLVKQEIPVYHTEKRYIRKDGSVIWGSTTVNIIRNTRGEAVLYFAMIEDITARRKAETELISAKEKAEESDRLKTAFLHNVSHEIRTPMNAILGFSSLLNETGINADEQKQFVDVIFQSGNQLLSIINDIVDLASIESGQVKLNMREINLNSELRKLSEQFGYKQKPQDITLILDTPFPDKNAHITTDGTKLIQILSNLINNAFKFTKKGRITFGYSQKENCLEFFVRDTGVGIAPEHQKKVFDRFYQVDSAVSRHYSGTGLGLSICRAYVELLGGTIWLTSQPGEGSVFKFTLPYKKKEGE